MLVDGSYCLYSAYYALDGQDLRNRRGEPTGALYGLFSQVYRLQRDFKPSHIAVMLDSKGSLRKEKYADYKKNRNCPDDLKGQLNKAYEACNALAVPWKAMEGYEADDLIGHYALEASKECDSVNIVSVDKDLLQLASPKIRILPDLKVSDLKDQNNWMDDVKVEELWDVKPSQMVDLLALVGDSADAIPGVPGIGKKKAAALLKRHETLDRVFEAARNNNVGIRGIGPKLVESLVVHEAQAREMRKLVEFINPGDALDASEWRTFRTPKHDDLWLNTAQEFLLREDMNSLIDRLHRDQIAYESSTPRPRATAKPPPSVVRVEDVAAARHAMEVLERHCEDADRLFFVSVEGLEDGSRALCFSVFGTGLDFGGSDRLWVDLMGTENGARCDEIMDAFRSFFVDSRFRKVYHCFSEEWRQLAGTAAGPGGLPPLSHGGFAGDTLHMARLLDPSMKSYELDKICMNLGQKGPISAERHRRKLQLRLDRKGGSPSQLQSEQRDDWVLYATSGAVALHELHRALRARLEKKAWELEGPQVTPEEMQGLTMWDLYLQYWKPLGQLLLDMELRGVPTDRTRLDALEAQALSEMEKDSEEFKAWALQRITEEHGPEAAAAANLASMNLNSTQQLSQLLFGPRDAEPQKFVVEAAKQPEAGETAEPSTSSGPGGLRCDAGSASSEVGEEAAVIATALSREELEGMRVDALKNLLKERGLQLGGKKADLVERLLDPNAKRAVQRRAVRRVHLSIPGLGLQPADGYVTKLKKQPQVSIESLQALATQQAAALRQEGVEAIAALVRRQKVEAVLSGFLWPLRSYISEQGRVHAFINLNTETGRLSSRQPNLMGEPVGKRVALREAFVAPPGRRLIVADYGQLELRVCAHLADCAPMIELLDGGGDIHSRTAHRMFREVRDAVAAGEATVDASWPGAKPGVPLVKESFPEERRRAKVLNFSVLYGKTAWTLSKEWGVPPKEAEDMIEKWYQSFPEVRAWKSRMEQAPTARTLMGRERPVRRKVEDSCAATQGGKQQWRQWKPRQATGHMLRAASNTPVQGSAADIVISAMIRLEESQRLRDLGYQQLLQVHDEVLLEGPEENAEEALKEVVKILEDPLPFHLKVPLKVDARHASTWQEGKPS